MIALFKFRIAGMGILASFAAYIADTYSPDALLMAMEVILVALNFVSVSISGDLEKVVLNWHTLFMAAECFCYFFVLMEKNIFKFRNNSVPMNVIVGMLAYAGRKQLWVFSIPILLINAFVRISKKTTDLPHIAVNAVMGVLIYIAHEQFSHFIHVVYLMKLVQLIILFSISELHVSVKSLAMFVFDILYRLIGETERRFYVAFASLFVLHFISQLLKDYKK